MPIEWPLIIGGAAIVGGELGADPGRLPVDGGAQWIFPLPIWRGYKPEVSDGFQGAVTADHRKHLGADIMYRRKRSGVVQSPEERIDGINGTKLYFVPAGMVAYAVHDGRLWSTGETELGFNVVLDAGKPYACFYQHLSTLLVPVGVKSGLFNGRPFPIRAGDPLGVVGGARTGYKLRHLHFEVWKGGDRDTAIDPRSTEAAGGLGAWQTITLTGG